MGLLNKASVAERGKKDIGELQKDLLEFLGKEPSLLGIVLGNSQKNETGGTLEEAAAMASPGGTALKLPSGKLLVLLPPSLDGELLGHRLSLSLRRELLGVFEADTPDAALQVIQSCL